MITELPLVPFVIINLTSLTAGVCMKVRFRSKVTRGFPFSPLRNSHSPLRGSLTRGKIQEKPLGPGYPSSSITWSGMGKQNIQAEKVYRCQTGQSLCFVSNSFAPFAATAKFERLTSPIGRLSKDDVDGSENVI